METTDPDPLDAIAPLAEPVRRRLYVFVAEQDDAVDRDTAAVAVGIGRPLAAFHLDRLVDAGLLETEYRRRTGRAGPGAGRPAKFYRRAGGRELAVSVPPRQYHLAAAILAEAATATGDATAAVLDAARRAGERIGASACGKPAVVDEQLARNGYQPTRDGDVIRLRNCPFDRIAETHRELVCPMNRSLIEGLLAGAGASGLRAEPQPRDGWCCVALVPST